MQYATESKLYFRAYDAAGDPTSSIDWSQSTVQISKDGGSFTACANTPVSCSDGWYCLTLTASEMTCDAFVIRFTPYPTTCTIPPVTGEPQRVTPATDTSTLATASAVSALQTTVARILGLAGNFTINGTTLTATNADGTTTTYTLTLDSDGNITAITEATA